MFRVTVKRCSLFDCQVNWWKCNLSHLFIAPCMTSHLSLKAENIKLNDNGSFARESRVPQCPTGSRIHLLSYKYYKKVCNDICITEVYNLSAEAEINLHEACSFKAKCANMLFPITDMIKADNIYVKYKCEGKQIFTTYRLR